MGWSDLAEINAAAAAANAEAGLPPLHGSPAQVTWAETLRKTRIAAMEDLLPFVAREKGRADLSGFDSGKRIAIVGGLHSLNVSGVLDQEIFTIFLVVLRRQASARWWIDSRSMEVGDILLAIKSEVMAEMQKDEFPTPEQAAVEAEAVLKPACEPVSSIVAEVRHVGNSIHVAYPEKREEFRQTMRGLGYHWNKEKLYWVRDLDFTSGALEDRLAEIAQRILAAGFIVRLHDEAARAKALDGSFIPEQRRWVCMGAGEFKGWLMITWPRNDDLYSQAKSLPGSRYKNGAVYVPAGAIEAVADFAERFGFSMSDTPRRLLAEHRAALEQGAVVTRIMDGPTPVQAGDANTPPVLTPEVEDIADELRDED